MWLSHLKKCKIGFGVLSNRCLSIIFSFRKSKTFRNETEFSLIVNSEYVSLFNALTNKTNWIIISFIHELQTSERQKSAIRTNFLNKSCLICATEYCRLHLPFLLGYNPQVQKKISYHLRCAPWNMNIKKKIQFNNHLLMCPTVNYRQDDQNLDWNQILHIIIILVLQILYK